MGTGFVGAMWQHSLYFDFVKVRNMEKLFQLKDGSVVRVGPLNCLFQPGMEFIHIRSSS